MNAAAVLVGRRARNRGRSFAHVTCALAVIGSLSAAALALRNADAEPELVAVVRVLMVAAPVAAGLYAYYGGAGERFALLLIATGAAGFVTTLAESGDELVYTVGRAAGWLVEVLLVYVTLCFPTGRLTRQSDRLIVAAMAATVAALYLPRLALAAHFEVPSPYTSCVHDCPANALFAFDSEPAVVDAVMRPLGVALVFVIMAAVVVRLWSSTRASTRVTRQMLIPVVAVTTARAGMVGAALVARQVHGGGRALELTSWLLALAVPAIALAFLAGLVRWRLYAERVMRRLADCLQAVPSRVTLQHAFAEAFDDPKLTIVFPDSAPRGGWMDLNGHPVDLPSAGSGRCISEVLQRNSVVAAIVHDEGLCARPELVGAAVSMAGVALENQRLAAEAAASLHELQRSRGRVASAERERRRIERDLHDGAQQRLVALRIELELAEDVVRRDAQQGVARLRELELDVEEALEELRALAHGVYPPLLADRGLPEALRAVAARCRIPVALVTHAVARYPPEIESAVYFCVLEAIQNVLKHAVGAQRVAVCLDAGADDQLWFSVRDDGAGAPGGNIRAGRGIANMLDRVVAVGGDVHVTSTPGAGTEVRGRVPAAHAAV